MKGVHRTQHGWAPFVIEVDGERMRAWRSGVGPGLLVLGGALRTALDYRAFADALRDRYEVILLERRGRPGSPPLRAEHDVSREVNDLIAVQEVTGARRLFGHSFGGLVALEALARHPSRFDAAAVYEPGVSVNGAISTQWIGRYQELLSAGARRRAFAWFIQSSGQAPPITESLPLWYLTAVLSVVFRGHRWRSIDRLLEANAIEHRLVAEAGDRPLDRFATIAARLLLLGGERSPSWMTRLPFSELVKVVAQAQFELVPKVGHLAPDDEAPAAIAARCAAFFSTLGAAATTTKFP